MPTRVGIFEEQRARSKNSLALHRNPTMLSYCTKELSDSFQIFRGIRYPPIVIGITKNDSFQLFPTFSGDLIAPSIAITLSSEERHVIHQFLFLNQEFTDQRSGHGLLVSTIKQQLVDQKKRKIELGIMNDNEGSQTYSTCLNNGQTTISRVRTAV